VVCFRYAERIDIELDTGLGNLTWGSVPIGCQGVMRKDAHTDATLRSVAVRCLLPLLNFLEKIKKNKKKSHFEVFV